MSDTTIEQSKPELQVHPLAKAGFATGTNELYNRARPSYPPDVLSHIRKCIGPKQSVKVVEFGSGTGIFTRVLLSHPEWNATIDELIAVEPSEGMRDTFAKTVKDARVRLTEGTFDRTVVQDGWADLIVIAQAFHWCSDHDAAVAEFTRILKPDGAVFLVWNRESKDMPAWVSQLKELQEPYKKGIQQQPEGQWRTLFERPSYQSHFQPAEETIWPHSLPGSLETSTNLAMTFSYIAILPEEEKLKLKENMAAIIKRGDGMVWIDEKEGLFECPIETLLVTLSRR